MPTEQQIQNAIDKVQNLHASPSILAKACRQITDPNSTFDDLAEIIRLDEALVAEIISLSNSVALRLSDPAGNLEAAVRRIGPKEIHYYLGMSVSRNTVAKDLDRYGMTAKQHWLQSISVAFLMEQIALKMGGVPEEAYTLGIMHAVGRIVINQALGDLGKTTSWDTSKSLEEWEMESLGLCHPGLGATILRAWGFPDHLCEAVRLQSRPRGEGRGRRLTAELLNYCVLWVSRNGCSFNGETFDHVTDHPLIFQEILSYEQMDKIRIICSQKVRAACRLLELN